MRDIIILIGGSGSPKIDIIDKYGNIRDNSSVICDISATPSDLYSIERLSRLSRFYVGGRNILNEFSVGHFWNKFTDGSFVSGSLIYALGSAILGGAEKLYIGTSDGMLKSYDGASFVDLTGYISTVWGTNPIYRIKFNGSYLLIGGGTIALPLLYKYDGTTWTNLSANLTAFTTAVKSIDWSFDLGIWLLGDDAGHIYKWDGTTWTDLSTAAALNGKPVLSIKWSSYKRKFYVGTADKQFKSFDGTDWVDLSSNLLGFGSTDDVEVIEEVLSEKSLYIAGNGHLNSYDFTTFRDLSLTLIGLNGASNIRGIKSFARL